MPRKLVTVRANAILLGAFVYSTVIGLTLNCVAGELDHILFQAIRQGDTPLVASLLRQGTPANLRSSEGTSPLMYAALHGDAECVRLLLEHGADPNVANNIGATALIWGAGDAEKVKLLLARGAKVNVRSRMGNSPLIVASAFPAGTPAVELLLRGGADIHARNNRNTTALRNSLYAGNVDVARMLLARGVSADEEKSVSRSNLAIAAEQGSIELVSLLLEHGADPNHGNSGRHSLNAALLAQQPEIARLLISHGARLDRKLGTGRVPSIVLAAYSEIGDTSVARLMIDRKADVTGTNQSGETAITWARKRGNQALIDLLRQADAPDGVLKDKAVELRDVDWHTDHRDTLLRGAISRSLALLQHSSDVFLEKRESCVSCHHQNLPSVALGWARDRGFQIDSDSVDRMIEGQIRSWSPRIDRAYQMDRPVPVPARFIGYGLLGFAALGYPRDEVTDAHVRYLANIQRPAGSWAPEMRRPPMGGGEILATALSMRALQQYPVPGQRADMVRRIDMARRWLRQATPRIHQEQIYQLLGLAWSGVMASELTDELESLKAAQRTDGGWAQLPGLTSDAWATGQSLVALRIAGGMPPTGPVYQRGMRYLLGTQFEDGSWYVRTRTWPFQSHFDSEFPHGKDQWVSAPATAWSVMALLLALEPSDSTVVDDRVASLRAEARSAIGSQRQTAEEASSQSTATPADSTIDFVKQVQPLFQRSCVGCHSGENPKSDFRMTTRKQLLKGGDYGESPVRVGASEKSPLIQFVTDQVEDMEMPPLRNRDEFPAFTVEEVETLQRWIEQGAKWPADVVVQPAE